MLALWFKSMAMTATTAVMMMTKSLVNGIWKELAMVVGEGEPRLRARSWRRSIEIPCGAGEVR